MTIPWGPRESANGNVASFAGNSSYVLKQTEASGNHVLPAGYWTVTISRENGVSWGVVSDSQAQVNRTMSVKTDSENNTKAVAGTSLGGIFTLYNDLMPDIIYHPNGGVLTGDFQHLQLFRAF